MIDIYEERDMISKCEILTLKRGVGVFSLDSPWFVETDDSVWFLVVDFVSSCKTRFFEEV